MLLPVQTKTGPIIPQESTEEGVGNDGYLQQNLFFLFAGETTLFPKVANKIAHHHHACRASIRRPTSA